MRKFKIFLVLFAAVTWAALVPSAAFGENTAFHQILRERRSIRHFQQKEIPLEILRTCLEDVLYAPSAMNQQPWQFIVVTNDRLRQQIFPNIFWLADDKPGKNEQPVAYVFFLVPAKENSLFVNMAFCVANFVNAAWAESIGTCLIGSFREKELKRILKIPAGREIFLVAACGYPIFKKIPQIVNSNKQTEPYRESGVLKVPKKTLGSVLFLDYYGERAKIK